MPINKVKSAETYGSRLARWNQETTLALCRLRIRQPCKAVDRADWHIGTLSRELEPCKEPDTNLAFYYKECGSLRDRHPERHSVGCQALQPSAGIWGVDEYLFKSGQPLALTSTSCQTESCRSRMSINAYWVQWGSRIPESPQNMQLRSSADRPPPLRI